MKTFDSAHLLATIGSLGGFFLANYDRLAAAICAVIGASYTIWKWRRDSAGLTK